MKKRRINNKINNKGQLTIFIIVAVIIVGVGITLYLINSKSNTSDINIKFSSDPQVQEKFNLLKDSIVQCMENTCQDSLNVIGYQGGYYKKPISEVMEIENVFIPYYYNVGKFSIPTKETIQRELGSFVDDKLKYCIDNITRGDFALEYKTTKTRSFIDKKSVLFTIDMPINIKKDDLAVILELKDLQIEKESYLYDMYDIAKFITESHKEDPDMICVTCLYDLLDEKDLYADFFDLDNVTSLVLISENKTLAPDWYYFEFLNKYKEKELIPAPGFFNEEETSAESQ